MPSGVYDSSHLYNFPVALATARGATRVLEPNRFEVDDGLYFRQLRRMSQDGKWSDLPAPSGDGLRKHALRFGNDQVRETAALYGVDMRLKSAPKVKRHRRTTAELTAQVVELRNRGLVESAIADSLNIGDERVRSIIRSEAEAVRGEQAA